MFFKNGNQSNATFEHLETITGLTMVESWIVEDEKIDKSNLYNLGAKVGTWMGTIKVDNDVIWNDFIKTGLVKGFSIEGYFADKAITPLKKIQTMTFEHIENKKLEKEVEEEIEAGLELLEIKSLFDYYGRKV